MINGLILPNAGAITINGNVGAMIELGTGFNPVLSGRENVYINAAVLGLGKQEVDQCMESIVEFAELAHVIDEPVKTYSSGMKMRLGFSIGANLRPQLLLIDEVLAVGDVAFRMKCFNHLRELVKSGTIWKQDAPSTKKRWEHRTGCNTRPIPNRQPRHVFSKPKSSMTVASPAKNLRPGQLYG